MNKFSIIEHTLENHAGFKGKHIIKFNPDKPSVIFGINGSGKTSLLNAICYSISLIVIENTGLAIHSKDLDLSVSSITKGKLDTFLSSKLLIDKKSFLIEFKYSGNYRNSKNNQKDYLKIRELLLGAYSNNKHYLPVFRYFRYNKLVENLKTVVTSQSFNNIENRSLGYTKHNKQYLSIQQITNFFINQINIENQLKIDNRDLNFQSPIANYIRQTLNTFTTTLYGEEVKVKTGASKYSSGQSLILVKEEEELEFLQLSSGEQYVFGMVLELIYRNTILNSTVEKLENAPGIVLIDEIESHLHPRWQLTILEALQKSFPKIQFIVSSHSPLVASSVRKEQIIALNNFNIIPWENLSNIYSGTANEMLRDILFSDFQINKFDVQKKEINRLLNELNFELAEEKLASLKKEVQASPKWIKDYERKISFNKKWSK